MPIVPTVGGKFWTSNKVEPKRKFRFIMSLGGTETIDVIESWYVKTAKKPTWKMEGQGEVKYIQHTWKYPGRIKWDPIDTTVIDPASPDSASILMNILATSGYSAPFSTLEADGVRKSISKQGANNAMGRILLSQIDADGEPIEEWLLHNAFLTGVDFGGVDYGSDDIVEYTLNVDYDFATLNQTSTPVERAVRTKG